MAGLRPRSSCADSADWRPTLLEEGCPELTLERIVGGGMTTLTSHWQILASGDSETRHLSRDSGLGVILAHWRA